MERNLIMLGTGNAMVTKCYNTCFAIQNGEEYPLVDAGGGNGILGRLEEAEIPVDKIHYMFVTHAHTDHVLGVVWVIRKVATMMRSGAYEGNFKIYCHEDLADTIMQLCTLTLVKKFTVFLGDRILIKKVKDCLLYTSQKGFPDTVNWKYWKWKMKRRPTGRVML